MCHHLKTLRFVLQSVLWGSIIIRKFLYSWSINQWERCSAFVINSKPRALLSLTLVIKAYSTEIRLPCTATGRRRRRNESHLAAIRTVAAIAGIANSLLPVWISFRRSICPWQARFHSQWMLLKLDTIARNHKSPFNNQTKIAVKQLLCC